MSQTSHINGTECARLKATSTLGELVIPEYFEIIRVTASFNPARFLAMKKKKKRKKKSTKITRDAVR